MAAADAKHEDDDLFSPNEVRRMLARIHNLNDAQQGHALFIEGHRIEIQRTKELLSELSREVVRQPQFSHALNDIMSLRETSATRAEILAMQTLQASQLKTLQESVAKIDANLSRGVWIVLATVIVAALGLVIRAGGVS